MKHCFILQQKNQYNFVNVDIKYIFYLGLFRVSGLLMYIMEF